MSANAQRYAVIDTKYILDKMQDYKDAQKALDDFSAAVAERNRPETG